MCVSGSYEPPGQFVTPVVMIVPYGPSALLAAIGVKIGPIRYFETSFTASARSSGVKSIKSSIDGTPATPYAAGFVGNGCVGEYHSPGTSPFGTGRSSIGQIGTPVTRSNVYRISFFVGCATTLIVRPLTVTSMSIGAQGISKSQMP